MPSGQCKTQLGLKQTRSKSTRAFAKQQEATRSISLGPTNHGDQEQSPQGAAPAVTSTRKGGRKEGNTCRCSRLARLVACHLPALPLLELSPFQRAQQGTCECCCQWWHGIFCFTPAPLCQLSFSTFACLPEARIGRFCVLLLLLAGVQWCSHLHISSPALSCWKLSATAQE